MHHQSPKLFGKIDQYEHLDVDFQVLTTFAYQMSSVTTDSMMLQFL